MMSEKDLIENNTSLQEEVQNLHHDDHEELHDEEISFPDVSNLSKEELANEVQQVRAEGNLSKVLAFLRDAKSHYDELLEADRNEALEQFKQNGGLEEDFELKKDPSFLKFESAFSKLKKEISEKINSLEHEKEKNLKNKLQILDKLRELTSGEESSTSLTALKELQDQWKNTGPVPTARTKELWANYNALVEMFYNNRSIYFELKELDRKKNYEGKKEIIERAERLVNHENIGEAIRELRKLHEEYKNIGPVPKEDQEQLWDKFKEISDSIYNKRNQFQEQNKKILEENLSKKQALIEKVKLFVDFDTSEINSWKDKTKEILVVQDEWKKTGPVPKELSKEISKEFWSGYKGFFKKKELFFKDLENIKKENLEKKVRLCEKAEELKESDNLNETTDHIKALQAEWNKIGPVPVKEKDEIFKRFKAACDQFFNRKREQYADQEKEYEVNLKNKLEIISNIEKLAASSDKNPDSIKSLQIEFNGIGYVPKKDVKEVKDKYKAAVEKYLENMDTTDSEGRENMKLELEVSAMKADPSSRKKIQKREGDVLRKIHQLKSDIQTFNTNIDFLANSPKADKLKDQVNQKIHEAKNELESLQEQLKIIRDNK